MCLGSVWVSSAWAMITPDQPISRLLREDDSTYFPLFDFELISSIREVTTTPGGGFIVNAKTGVSFGDNYSINPPQANLAKDHIFGDIDGLAGAVLQVEDPAATINIGGTNYARVQYSTSIGYNASNGKLIYGADIDLIPDAPNKTNRKSAIFVGNTPAIVQGDMLPTGNGFAGAVSTGLTFAGSSGDTAFYKSTYAGGAGLFTSTGQVLLYTGIGLGPSGDTLLNLGNSNVSDNGAHYIINPDINLGPIEALVINGQIAQTPSGTFLRDGDQVVAGGAEVFDDFNPFNQVAINNAGKWAASATVTNAGNDTEVIMVDGLVVFREGDVLPRLAGGNAAPLAGLPQYVDVNNNGDVAFFFGSGSSSGALVLNGQVVLQNGDLIGTDTIDKFAVAPIALSDRDANGIVHLYFKAKDSSGFDANSFALYHMSFVIGNPADLDNDGDVDDADFGIAFAAFTGPGGVSNSPADLDNDGDVDDADFGIAFAAFTGPGGAVNVPEPASALLLTLTVFACSRRRRG